MSTIVVWVAKRVDCACVDTCSELMNDYGGVRSRCGWCYVKVRRNTAESCTD